MFQLYRFDAPDGHVLLVGDDVHQPGAVLELPAGQVDPRLTPVGEGEEVVAEETEPVDDRSLSETVQDEVDSIDEDEDEAEAEAEAETGFGNPRPAARKSGK